MCTLNIFFSFCRRCSTNTCTNRWVNLYDIYPFDFVPKSSVRMWHIGLFDTYIYLSISMKMLQCNYKLYQKSSHYLYIDLQHLSLEKYTVLWNVPPFWYTLLCIQKYQQNCFLNWLTLCFRPMHVSGSCLQPGSRLEGQLWHRVCLWERYLWILPMHQYVCPFPIIQTIKIYLHLLRNVWLLFPNIEALWSYLTCISLLVRKS